MMLISCHVRVQVSGNLLQPVCSKSQRTSVVQNFPNQFKYAMSHALRLKPINPLLLNIGQCILGIWYGPF